MTADLEKLRLKLDQDGSGTVDRTYDIYPLETVDISSTKNAFSIAPPGLAAAENILLGVSGMEADLTIQGFVWDDGTDRANGTHTEAVTTVAEQNRYLEDVMHAPDFGAAFNDDDVFLETVEPTAISQSNPKWKPLRLRLRRGSSVG